MASTSAAARWKLPVPIAAKPVALSCEDIRGIGAGRQIIKVAGLPPLFVCERLPYYAVNPWKSQLRDVRDLHSGKA